MSMPNQIAYLKSAWKFWVISDFSDKNLIFTGQVAGPYIFARFGLTDIVGSVPVTYKYRVLPRKPIFDPNLRAHSKSA